ncbi:hypothetical protein AVEN_212712-1, partial [Araneus ventricosus]
QATLTQPRHPVKIKLLLSRQQSESEGGVLIVINQPQQNPSCGRFVSSSEWFYRHEKNPRH